MTWTRYVPETEFYAALSSQLHQHPAGPFRAVTGPGRSGAIAAVYSSHILGIPFLPFGSKGPENWTKPLLIVDTARETGATIRKAMRKYAGQNVCIHWVYSEHPRVKFWYEERR